VSLATGTKHAGRHMRALVMDLVEGETRSDSHPVRLKPDTTCAPANIKVRPDGTVKVLDFGLAKALGTA
jgi:serine/threonine protein kinase